MKTAIFRYKCRLCYEMFDGCHTSEENAKQYLLNAVHGFPLLKKSLSAFNKPVIVETHPGCKKGWGVADMIGYELREEQ